jgi:hypothetical protein
MSDRGIRGFTHRVQGEEISWAGMCPWTGNLCFGMESGRLYLAPASTGQQPPAVRAYDFVTEPVNGVAFTGDLVGVTSRREVVVGRRRADGGLDLLQTEFHGGAHGILALPSGGFAAPLGTDGLLFLTEEKGKIATRVSRIEGERPNFYKAVLLSKASDDSVLACAAQDSGLFAMTVEGSRVTAVVSHEFPGIDVVDVYSLNSKDRPRAAVALNNDGSLLFFTDVLGKMTLPPIRLGYTCGVPYTVLSAQGHVFVLTSEEFTVIPGLATRFLRGERMDQPIDVAVTQVQAVDVFLCGDESVFLIEEEEALEYQVADLAGQVADPVNRTTLRPTLSIPAWQTIQWAPMIFVPAA